MPRHASVVSLLAVTQILGWAAVGVMPVLAAPIAAALSTDLAAVFLGTSVMFVSMALAAPFAGRLFRRHGPQRVMMAGAGLTGIGLIVVGLAPGLPLFWLGWALTGAAGALYLTTAAYAYLADHAGAGARSLIGTLMLVTGLSGSLFWPVTAWMEHLLGWRVAVLVWAGVLILLVCPLIHFGLPRTSSPEPEAATGRPPPRRGLFWLMVAAITLSSFVTFGIEAVGIELLRALGADLAGAVAVASVLGMVKVGGRVIDLLGGSRWNGLQTALVAGTMIPLGLAVLWTGGVQPWALGGYLVLFGLGSGAFAVARATLPLVFFSRADYGAAMALLALPMNLINALAPPLLAALLTGPGPRAALGLLTMASATALLLLVLLNRLRDRAA